MAGALWQLLAESYAKEENWAQALDATRETLKLDPFNLVSRELLIRCLIQRGDKIGARTELKGYLTLLPPQERDATRSMLEPLLR